MEFFLLEVGSVFIESRIGFLLFMIPLMIGARYDYYREKMVPDVIPALMWVLCSFMLLYNPFAYLALPISFAFLFFLSSLFAWYDKEFLGWSDILALPPLLCMLVTLFSMSGNVLILLLLPIAYIVACVQSGMVKEVPFYLHMAAAYVLAIVLSA